MSCVLLSKRIDAYQTGKQLLAKISVDDTSVLNDSTENIITLVTCVKGFLLPALQLIVYTYSVA